MTNSHSSINLETVTWADYSRELYDIRYRVFVLEQGVPVELEQDEYDPLSWHVLARSSDGLAIGTGRLMPDGHIGRLAVLKEWRQYGVGRKLMEYLIGLAQREGFQHIRLNAQVTVTEFYEKLGFCSEGEIFMEAGIPHQSMYRALK